MSRLRDRFSSEAEMIAAERSCARVYRHAYKNILALHKYMVSVGAVKFNSLLPTLKAYRCKLRIAEIGC